MAAIEFDRLVSYFDADLGPLEKGVAAGIKLVDKLEARFEKFKGKLGKGNLGIAEDIDRELRAAEGDIRRFEQQRARYERQYSQTVEREGRQRTASRNREQRRAANDFLAHMRRVNAEERRAARQSSMFSGFGGRSALGGALAFGAGAGAALGLTTGLTAIASEGREAYVSLEKLVRFTATLDRSFQAPQALISFRKEIEALSVEVPQSAENIARASFSVKSAYQNMTRPELISFLRTLSIQATASNTTVDQHADRVIALAKLYNVTAKELDTFGAIMATSFGDALAGDAAVGEGFNKILVSARSMKQPLNEVAAAMGAIQSTSSDAEKNTTNLQNVFAKLGDPKYIQGIKEVFNIDVFDAQGSYKGLNQIVNELAKSLEGLSDKEKSAKIGEVFKDLQAREGLLSLIEVLGQYNDRLRDGADQDAWAAKQKVMLDSAESRWALFTNRVEQMKRDIGAGVADPFTEAQASQTSGGGFALFFAEAKHSVEKGALSLGQAITSAGAKLNTEFGQFIGHLDAQDAEKINQGVDRFFDAQREYFANKAEVSKGLILVNQRKYWQDIANDPASSEELRRGATEKANALTKHIEEISAKIAEANRLAAERAAKEAVTGLDVAPAAQTAGETAGTSFGTGVQTGIAGQKGAITNAAGELLPADAPGADAKGQTIGQRFAAGVAAGIRSGGGMVGLAVAALIDAAFASGQAAQDSHSPSRRAAEELGRPFIEGIEVGVRAREAQLANTTMGVLTRAMFGPKTKKRPKAQTDDAIKFILAGLADDAGRIDAAASRSRQALERLFDAVLSDQTAGYDAQVASIAEFYDRTYAIEEEAYQKRLANIAQREAEIRKLKKIKPEERARELGKLGDEREDLTADREQQRFDRERAAAAAVVAAGLQRVERGQREFAREVMSSENAMIGVRRSAEQEAQTNHDNELRRLDNLIQGYRDEQANFAAGSAGYVEMANRIAEAEQDRADAVVKGTGDIKKARQDDARSLADYAARLADFARQTSEAQFGAEEQRIEMMKAAGASSEAVFAAEIALATRKEQFRHTQATIELEQMRNSLLALATTEEEKVRIAREFNAQMEAEMQRHNSAMGQIAAENASTSILGQWRRIAAQLPTYKQQLKDFAGSIPNMIGDTFAGGIQNMDGTWKGFLEGLKQAFFQTIQQMLAELARAQLIKGLTGLLGSVLGGLGGAASSAGSGGGGQFDWIGQGYASGGVPPVGRLSVVGENGPEIFVPNVSGRVLSHEDSMEAVAGRGSGGDTYNLTVNQTIRGPRGLVAPRSLRQQTEAAVLGLSMGVRGRRE